MNENEIQAGKFEGGIHVVQHFLHPKKKGTVTLISRYTCFHHSVILLFHVSFSRFPTDFLKTKKLRCITLIINIVMFALLKQ